MSNDLDQNTLINNYFKLQNEVHGLFEYTEDWRIFPMVDNRDYFWYLDGDSLLFCDDDNFDDSNTYGGEIYHYRHIRKHVFKTSELTMMLVDTRCDSNIVLMIFSNDREVTE